MLFYPIVEYVFQLSLCILLPTIWDIVHLSPAECHNSNGLARVCRCTGVLESSYCKYHHGFKIQLPPNVSSVGVDPYLRWIRGTAFVTNSSYYGHFHDMFGTLLPAWNLHFSSYSAGETSCPSGRHPYCNTPSVRSSNDNPSKWHLASEWASYPSPPINWQHPPVSPKEIVNFEIHEPTVAGIPLQLELKGTMQAGWFYNYFSINASINGTQGYTHFTATNTQTTTNTTTSNKKQACASPNATPNSNGWCTITTTSTQTFTVTHRFTFLHPATVSATLGTTQLTPTNEVLLRWFPFVREPIYVSTWYLSNLCSNVPNNKVLILPIVSLRYHLGNPST